MFRTVFFHFFIFDPHLRTFSPVLFRERVQEKRVGESGREKHGCERDISTGCLPHVPRPGVRSEPPTHVHALDWKSNL